MGPWQNGGGSQNWGNSNQYWGGGGCNGGYGSYRNQQHNWGNECWVCNVPDCMKMCRKAGAGPCRMQKGETACTVCYNPRGTAFAFKQAQQATSMKELEEKKEAARKLYKEQALLKANAAVPGNAPATAKPKKTKGKAKKRASSAEDAKDTTVQIATIEIEDDEFGNMEVTVDDHAEAMAKMGMTHIPDAKGAKGFYVRPTVHVKPWTAQDLLLRALETIPAGELDAAQAKLDKATQFAELAEDMGPASVKAAAEQLQVCQKEVTRLSKQSNRPGALDPSTQIQRAVEERDRELEGKSKIEASGAKRMDAAHNANILALDFIMAQAAAFKAALQADHAECKETWLKTHTTRDKLHAEVNALLLARAPPTTSLAITENKAATVQPCLTLNAYQQMTADLALLTSGEHQHLPDNLPPMVRKPTIVEITEIERVRALMQKVEWGSLPTVRFVDLGLETSFAHGLIGTPMWVQFWGELREDNVANEDWIPHQMVSLIAEACNRAAAKYDLVVTSEVQGFADDRLAAAVLALPSPY